MRLQRLDAAEISAPNIGREGNDELLGEQRVKRLRGRAGGFVGGYTHRRIGTAGKLRQRGALLGFGVVMRDADRGFGRLQGRIMVDRLLDEVGQWLRAECPPPISWDVAAFDKALAIARRGGSLRSEAGDLGWRRRHKVWPDRTSAQRRGGHKGDDRAAKA